MHAAGKTFVKTYLKAIRDTFVRKMWNFPVWKALRVVGLLTVVIFFQSKKITSCKIKHEKEKTTFYYLMVFNLLKIIHPFESGKHLRTSWNLIATCKNIWYVTNRFKYKFVSVIKELSVTVTLLYFC